MYPTTDQLVAASSVMELTQLTVPQQDALRAQAISAIEAWTGQSFEPLDGHVEVVEAQGGAELWLPMRLRTLTAIRRRGEMMELNAVSVTSQGKRLFFDKTRVGVGYYAQALFEVSGGDYYTRFPSGALEIEGDWGWDIMPVDVASAIRMDMEDQALADANALTPTVNVARKLGLSSVAQGNLSLALGEVGSLTPRVVRILEPYVFSGGGGHLV